MEEKRQGDADSPPPWELVAGAGAGLGLVVVAVAAAVCGLRRARHRRQEDNNQLTGLKEGEKSPDLIPRSDSGKVDKTAET